MDEPPNTDFHFNSLGSMEKPPSRISCILKMIIFGGVLVFLFLLIGFFKYGIRVGSRNGEYPNETGAIQSLRAIVQAQEQYRKKYPHLGYSGYLPALGGNSKLSPPNADAALLLPDDLASGWKQGYQFWVWESKVGKVNGELVIAEYKVIAVPVCRKRFPARGFCVDQLGTITIDPNGGVHCTERLF